MIRSKHLEETELSPTGQAKSSPGTVSVSPRNGRRLLPLVAIPLGPLGDQQRHHRHHTTCAAPYPLLH